MKAATGIDRSDLSGKALTGKATMKRENVTPPGAVAILTRSDGVVIASASDFECQAPGGFKLYEAQAMRARRALADEAMRQLCSQDVFDVMRGYQAEKMLERLISDKGYRVSVVEVGGHHEA